MTPASIGRLRRVGGLDVRVPDYPGGRAVVSLVREDGLLWMGDTAEGRALAQHILAACDQADAEARNRRDVQRIEAETRARLHVLAKRAVCRGCSEVAGEDGLCGLCRDARDRAQRIVGPAGEVTL